MISDLSNIITNELASTLGQLLSKKTSFEDITSQGIEQNSQDNFIAISVMFKFKSIESTWIFYFPSKVATKFEFLMLGSMGEIKEVLDSECADAMSEIVSNICGSIVTSVNAQNFEDLGSVKFENLSNEIVKSAEILKSNNLFSFHLDIEGEKTPVLILFDGEILSHIQDITQIVSTSSSFAPSAKPDFIPPPIPPKSPANDNLMNLLGENSVQNLKLLFDIKLKLSVRLGTKFFLLKDILRWDLGEIIELDQMVNEPLEILVNGIKIGEGEAVVIEGKFGLKVKNIGLDKDKIKHIGLG